MAHAEDCALQTVWAIGERTRGGVDGLRWKHVDLDAGILTLEDSKTGSQRRVIGQAAVDLLREAKPKSAHPDD